MPDFGNPFSGLSLDRKLSKEELIRAIKFMLSAELEATQMYDQVADATTDKTVEKIIRDISDEERIHAGEFFKLLTMLDSKEAELFQKGQQEVEDKKEKKTLAKFIRVLAKSIHEAEYVWQKTEKGDAKTLMFKSPSTGKKYHVSPCASIDPYAAVLLVHLNRPNIDMVQKAVEEIKKQDNLSQDHLKKILTDHRLVLKSSGSEAISNLFNNLLKINRK